MATKISNFIIGMVLVSLFSIILFSFMYNISDKYKVTYTNQNSFNKLNELNNLSKQLDNSVGSISTGNLYDIIGGLFQSGYLSLKLAKTSLTTFISLNEATFDSINFENSNYFKISIAIIILIVIVIGIILSAIIKDKI